MKTIIAGSRTITNYKLVVKIIKELSKQNPSLKINEVVSGGARGVDKLGEQLAKEYNRKLTIFPAEWDRLGRGAGYIRNIQMADYADTLIAIWDGKSNGTRHMIDIARKKGLKVFVYESS